MTSPESVVECHLGPPSRLVSRTKSGYRTEFPDHLVVWNAQIHVDGATVWRGDLDLSVDEPLLKAVAAEIGELYVLSEHEERFKPGAPPSLGRRFVYWTDGRGRQVGNGYWERFGWDEGALRKRD